VAEFTPQIEGELRAWTGSLPDREELEERWRLAGESVYRAALAILRERRADLLASPARWAVEGDYSQDSSGNLAQLNAQIAQLETLAEDPAATSSALTVSYMVRDRCGR
jgi:hypothetical protein